MSLDRLTRPDYLVQLAAAGLLWPGTQHEARRKPSRRFTGLPDWQGWTWRPLPEPWDVYRELAACTRLLADLEGHRLPVGVVEAGQLFEVHVYGRALPSRRVVALVECPVRGRLWMGGSVD